MLKSSHKDKLLNYPSRQKKCVPTPDRTAQLNEQLQEALHPIDLHIGINSGLALVGPTKLEGSRAARWTYTASGPVTNLAARIADIAESGDVLVGPETARRVETTFPIEALGHRWLKNIQDAVMVYRIRQNLPTP